MKRILETGQIGLLVVVLLGLSGLDAAMAQGTSKKYQVVINHEEQYSIWPADQAPEKGWRAVGYPCVKYECLEYIDKVWTDMRPLSIRKFVDDQVLRAKRKGYKFD